MHLSVCKYSVNVTVVLATQKNSANLPQLKVMKCGLACYACMNGWYVCEIWC